MVAVQAVPNDRVSGGRGCGSAAVHATAHDARRGDSGSSSAVCRTSAAGGAGAAAADDDAEGVGAGDAADSAVSSSALKSFVQSFADGPVVALFTMARNSWVRVNVPQSARR
jgi:hypothetical protein